MYILTFKKLGSLLKIRPIYPFNHRSSINHLSMVLVNITLYIPSPSVCHSFPWLILYRIQFFLSSFTVSFWKNFLFLLFSLIFCILCPCLTTTGFLLYEYLSTHIWLSSINVSLFYHFKLISFRSLSLHAFQLYLILSTSVFNLLPLSLTFVFLFHIFSPSLIPLKNFYVLE